MIFLSRSIEHKSDALLDRILLSIVLTLFLSLPFRTTSPSLVPFPLWPTFAGAAATHAFLSLLWVLRIKFVGIPALSYFTLVLLAFSLTAVVSSYPNVIRLSCANLMRDLPQACGVGCT